MNVLEDGTGRRISVSLLLALMINVLLFAMMQQMVAGRRIDLSDVANAQFIDYIRTPDQPETAPERRLRKPPPEPPEPPEEPPRQIQPVIKSVRQPLPQPLPRLKIDAPPATIDSDGPYLGPVLADAPATEGPGFIMAHDLVPILRRSPRYPRTLKRKEIEGYVVVEFTVTEQGLVREPVIIESNPHDDFGKSVMETVRYWKFQPYRKEGRPVAVCARQRVDFKLE